MPAQSCSRGPGLCVPLWQGAAGGGDGGAGPPVQPGCVAAELLCPVMATVAVQGSHPSPRRLCAGAGGRVGEEGQLCTGVI